MSKSNLGSREKTEEEFLRELERLEQLLKTSPKNFFQQLPSLLKLVVFFSNNYGGKELNRVIGLIKKVPSKQIMKHRKKFLNLFEKNEFYGLVAKGLSGELWRGLAASEDKEIILAFKELASCLNKGLPERTWVESELIINKRLRRIDSKIAVKSLEFFILTQHYSKDDAEKLAAWHLAMNLDINTLKQQWQLIVSYAGSLFPDCRSLAKALYEKLLFEQKNQVVSK